MGVERRILAPVDGSEASLRALALARELALALAMGLEVITVFESLHHTFSEDEHAVDLALRGHVMEKICEALPEISAHVHVDVEEGSVLPVLLTRAAAPGVEMVVIGRSGKGRIEQMFAGSTAHGLSDKALVPVLIVP